MISQKKHFLTILLTMVCVLAVGASAVAQEALVLTRPVLTSLHPSSVSAKSGTGSALVVASGQNFANGITRIQINGTARATTVINTDALVFELTAADLAQPGTLLVSVANRSAAGTFKSNSLPFVVLP